MTRVMVIGGSGMVGHVAATYLQSRGLDVLAVSRRPVPGVPCLKIDLENQAGSLAVEIAKGYDVVLNFAGVLNTNADQDASRTVLLNSWLPHWLKSQCSDGGSWLIHMSTDCVFSGESGSYKDSARPDALDLYGRSKALGEVVEGALTIRTSVVGPDLFTSGTGLFNWFMAQTGVVRGYADVSWTGVTTIQLAKALAEMISRGRVEGLVQLVNGETVSKYELLRLFNAQFPRVERIARDTSVTGDKSLVRTEGDLPLIPSYQVMVEEMRGWVDAHASLYPHYTR